MVPEEADEEAGEKQRDGLLRFHPEPDGHPDREPEPLVAGAQDAKHEPRHERPHHGVVDRRPFEVADSQEATTRDAQRSERLCEARDPPSSRAIAPVTTTTTPMQIAGIRRNANKESPKATRLSHATATATGG